MSTELKNKLISFIQNWISEQKGIDASEIEADEHVFQAGYVDSLGLFRLIFDIETEFDLQFDQVQLFNSGATSIRGLAKVMAEQA